MVDEPNQPDRDVGGLAIQGTAWMLGLRWSMRFAGLFSTAILARLLTPADFGIMAIAMVVFELIAVLRSSGVEAALIRLPEIDRRHYDTAWTIEVALGVVMAALLVIFATITADYFDNPEVEPILWCLAAMAMITSLVNMGMVEYRKELRLYRHFLWIALSRLIGIIATISAAFLFRNYWALVIGMLTQSVANLILSFILHRFRPRFSFAARADILGFSFWSLVQGVSGTLWRKLDQLVLAGNISNSQLGQYNRASELGEMINRELVAPLTPIALSAYSMVQLKLDRLRRGLLRGVGLACLLGYPAGVGAAVLAPDLVQVVLGDQWGFASDLLRILALFVLFDAVRLMISPLLTTQGRVKFLAGITWLEVGLLAAALIGLVNIDPIRLDHIALTRLALGVVFTVILTLVALRPYPGLLIDTIKQIARPLFAALIMGACLMMSYDLFTLPPFASIAVRVPLGAVIFFFTVYLLWAVTGREDGAEGELVERVQLYLKRRSQRRR